MFILRASYSFLLILSISSFIFLSHSRAESAADLFNPETTLDKPKNEQDSTEESASEYKPLKAPLPEIDRAPDSIEKQLLEAGELKESIFEFDPFNFVLKPWRTLNKKLKEKLRMEFSLAYTALYQVSSNATQGEQRNHAAGGIWDFNGLWQVLPDRKSYAAYLGFRSTSKHRLFTEIPPNDLAGNIGSLWSTAAFYSENPFFVSQLWLEQHILDNRLIIRLGKLDQSDYIDSFNFSSSKLFFINSAFSDNPTIPFPGNGLGAAALYQPNDLFYVLGSIGDANGDSDTFDFDTFFDEQEFFSGVEIGILPTINGHGSGNYHIALWHSDGSKSGNAPSGNGLALTFQQLFKEEYNLFLRYSFSNGRVTNVKQIVSGGVGLLDPFRTGLKKNLLGLAASWGEPEDKDLRSQYVIESFLRLQVFKSTQITPDLQLIINPSDAPGVDVIAIYGIRFRLVF